MSNGRSRRRPGVALVFFALMMLVLIPLVAFYWDFGFLLFERSRIQAAVDAAAKDRLRGNDPIDLMPNVDVVIEADTAEASLDMVRPLFVNQGSIGLRASARSQAVPVLTVGVAIAAHQLEGLASYAVPISVFDASPVTLDLATPGVKRLLADVPLRVGDALIESSTPPPLDEYQVFVPVVDASDWVVGFVKVDGVTREIQKNAIARENASPTLAPDSDLSPKRNLSVLATTLGSDAVPWLLTPALTREP